MALLLMRHAHAGDREAWTGPDHLRPLTMKGIRQAERLVFALADYGVHRVLSSPFTRCIQTVEPLALVRGVALESCEALVEGNGDAALQLVSQLAGAPVVLCTHGDVIGDVLATMPTSHGYRIQKGSVWVLEAEDGRYVSARYLPPG